MFKGIRATEILLSFLFALTTKQPILDVVNMRRRTRRNGRIQPGPLLLEYESEVIEREKLLTFYRARSTLLYTRVCSRY